MERCASLRSPERLEPAMMPVTDGKKRASAKVKSHLVWAWGEWRLGVGSGSELELGLELGSVVSG